MRRNARPDDPERFLRQHLSYEHLHVGVEHPPKPRRLGGAAKPRHGLRPRRDIQKAQHHMLIALAQNPDDDLVQRGEGTLCMDLGLYADAIRYFQYAARLRPRFGLTYMYLGDAYLKLNQPALALAEYERACSSEALEARYFFRYASLLVRTGNPDRAVATYQEGIQLAPGNLAARYDYGNLLLDLGRTAEAIEQYQIILKDQTDNPLVWHNLAAAYYQAGNMPAAIAAKDRANALDRKRSAATLP